LPPKKSVVLVLKKSKF